MFYVLNTKKSKSRNLPFVTGHLGQISVLVFGFSLCGRSSHTVETAKEPKPDAYKVKKNGK